ncbi:MAG TPA: CHAT domain-containing tetratricopeptide repeat protein [Blastocatellia bacterium]|nr:CHAT domain-containing tetratricopeptide repeat protein [Blastocatellia bacterium]
MIRDVSTLPLGLFLRVAGVAVSAIWILFMISAPPTPVDAAGVQGPPEELGSLASGASAEREISGLQTHSYRVGLSAGQLVEAPIQQKGIDLIVTLLGPDGQQLEEFSEPVYDNRIRKILFIAGSDGEYRLLLRPRLKDGAPGRYQLTIAAIRPATETDRTRVRATRLTKEASYALGNTNSLHTGNQGAITAKFEEALQLWQALDDPQMIGESLLSLGLVNHRIGEYTKARGFYERALPGFPATPEGESSRATVFNNLADTYLRLGETRRALEMYLKSLELKREAGRSRAITLDNIGSVYAQLGEYQLALDHHLQALDGFRALARRRDEAGALNNLAWLWEDLGDPERSVEYMRQALSVARELGDKSMEIRYLSNTGHFYLLIGEHRRALEYANQALELSRSVHNPRLEISSLSLLCQAYPAMGEFGKALDACQRALQLTPAEAPLVDRAGRLTSLSLAQEQAGESRKALETRQAALDLYRTIGDPNGELIALHALGRMALEGGDLVSARRQLEQALELIESVRVKVGSHELRATYLASRQQVYESYIDLLMQTHGQEPGAEAERTALQFSERARARSLLDLLAEGQAKIRQGADSALLERERSLLERLKAKDAALKQLRADPRTKAQAESLAREILDLTTQLQLVEAQIRSSSSRYSALTRPEPLSASEIARQVLDEKTVLLEYSVGEKRSWLWVVTPDSISSHQLPPRAEIETAARRVYELLTARQPKSGLAEAAHLKLVAESDQKLRTAATEFSRMLLGPVSAKLRQEWRGRRLAVVTSGALEYVPFAALPLPDGPADQLLIANHEIVNLPSASVLALIRREAAGPADKTLAVLADPVFEPTDPRVSAARKKKGSQAAGPVVGAAAASSLARAARSLNREGFSRLPFSREEAGAITELLPPNSVLKATDFQANRSTVTGGELNRYRIVHFATHGLINSEHPELSGLVLSLVDESGQAQDGFVRMHELFNLQLSADLVVLSACQTALGREIRGEGLIGLTRGFMYAGAERVIASLWQVDDQATAQLMGHLYRGMLKDGRRPAAALRAAQLEMLKQPRWSAPYFWAAFVMQGEWR